MKKQLVAMLSVAMTSLALTGCMTMPTPEYTSPNAYQGYDCTQLTSEYNRLTQYINANANQSTGISASGIGFGLGIGRGGVYPSVNIGMGTTNTGNRHNLAVAMGERDALVQAARMKQCSFITGVKLYSEK